MVIGIMNCVYDYATRYASLKRNLDIVVKNVQGEVDVSKDKRQLPNQGIATHHSLKPAQNTVT